MSPQAEVGQESYDQVINNTTHLIILYKQLLLGQEDHHHHCLLVVQFLKTKYFRIRDCSSITSARSEGGGGLKLVTLLTLGMLRV